MGVEVKLPHIFFGRKSASVLQVMEKLQRRGKTYLGSSFQVLLQKDVFDMVSGGTASSVPISEGNQEFIDIQILLSAVFPAVDESCRVGEGAVVVVNEGGHAASVHADPVEVVIGEFLSAAVIPEYFAGGEIFDSAAFHNLRKGGCVAKYVRKPEQLVIQAEFLPEEAFAVDKLAD